MRNVDSTESQNISISIPTKIAKSLRKPIAVDISSAALICRNKPKEKSEKRDKYHQQTSHNFNKTAVCCQRCPLVLPPPSLLHWCAGVYHLIFDQGRSNPIIFLELCLLGDYRQSVESPMGVPTFNSTEMAHTFTIYVCVLRFRSKKLLFYLNFTFVDLNSEQHHNVARSQRSNIEQE